MTTTAINPDATVSSAWTLVGAASVHAALNDASDATYVSEINADQDSFVVDLGTFVLNAGAQIRSFNIYARVAYATAPSSFPALVTFALQDATSGSYYGSSDGYVPVGMSTTIATFPVVTITSFNGAALTQALLDALRVKGRYVASVGGEEIRAYKLYVNVTVNERPVATVTAPAEAGSVTTTSRPTVTWTYSDPEADVQERYRVKIFSAAQYGIGGFDPDVSPHTWDSGEVVSGATSVVVGIDLTNSTTYRAYVKVSDVGSNSRWSAWDNNTFTMNLTPPAQPTLTITSQPNNTPQGPRVKLDVQRTGGTVPATTYFVIEYSDDAAVTWKTVRGAERINNSPEGTLFTVYDYELADSTTRQYRAKAVNVSGSNEVSSSWHTPGGVSIVYDGWWLKDPQDPTRNYQPLFFGSNFRRGKKENQAEFRALGRANPIILRGTMEGERMSLPFEALTQADFDKFNLIRSGQRTLLLQSGVEYEQWYISLGSDREVDQAGYDYAFKRWTVNATEVDRP